MEQHEKAKDQSTANGQTQSVLRSQGPVSTQELAHSDNAGIAFDFDPLQNGWVRADAVDDFDLGARRAGWPDHFKTPEVSLRACAASDAPIFRRLLDNPKIWAHLPNRHLDTVSEDGGHDVIALSRDPGLHKVHAICMNGQPVGQVRLELAEPEAELSYWVGEPFWRKGLGRTAVSMFVQACFREDPSLDHMIARVKPANTGSLRILETAGFVPAAQSNATPDWMILRRDRPA